jgi:hypothetical protein
MLQYRDLASGGRITDELWVGEHLEQAGRDFSELVTRSTVKGNYVTWFDRQENRMKAIISEYSFSRQKDQTISEGRRKEAHYKVQLRSRKFKKCAQFLFLYTYVLPQIITLTMQFQVITATNCPVLTLGIHVLWVSNLCFSVSCLFCKNWQHSDVHIWSANEWYTVDHLCVSFVGNRVNVCLYASS